MLMCAVVVAATMLVAVRSAVPFTPTAKKAYGEGCLVDDDCRNVFSCSQEEKQCLCRISLVISSDNRTCLNAVQYGHVCTDTAQCVIHVVGSVCGANNTCQCEEGFQHNIGDDHSCVRDPHTTPVLKKYGMSCSSQEQCKKNFTCIDNTCKCPAGYKVSKDNLACEQVLKKYGEVCSSSEECEKPFINCKSQKCECPANHTISEDKLKCRAAAASGAVAVQFSAGPVMLACLFIFILSTTSCGTT